MATDIVLLCTFQMLTKSILSINSYIAKQQTLTVHIVIGSQGHFSPF